MALTDFNIVREIDARIARLERRQELQHQETRYRLKAIEDGIKVATMLQSGQQTNSKQSLAEYFKPIISGAVNYGVGLAILLYVSQGGSLPHLIAKLLGLFG